MEIATYVAEGVHRRLCDMLRSRGFVEPIARYEQLSAQERSAIRILFGWRVPQSVVDSLPKLAWIQGAGAGVDWLMPVRLPAGVTVTRIVDQFGPDMGEYALLAALAWVKDWRRLYCMQQKQEWKPYLVGQLAVLSVGILGAGSIGAHIASMFRPLVREVRAMGRRRPEIPGVLGFSEIESTTFYRGLDLLIMVLPHTSATYHLVGLEQLRLMNPGSYLINIGRGAVLDQEALEAAVKSGHLSGAALDVFEVEPLPADSSLWRLPGITISPHLSGPSRVDGMADVFLQNLTRFRQGAPLWGVVERSRGY
ncbi:MAG: D-2-hydroxyacid dehydrogenase [Thermaerobacter sp.]|nr:D-2-hydroxyacid dehydrogenase [Thermaerobacter sp.]